MSKPFTAAMAFTALSASLMAMATPALANTAGLSFEELDLSSEAGRAELNARIERTVRQACTVVEATGSRIPNTRATRECMADARRQIDEQLERRAARTGLGG